MQAFSGDRDAAPGFFFHCAVRDFFVRIGERSLIYLPSIADVKMDLTGPIASRHLILSDMYTEGVKHYDCIKLAEMHCGSPRSSVGTLL